MTPTVPRPPSEPPPSEPPPSEPPPAERSAFERPTYDEAGYDEASYEPTYGETTYRETTYAEPRYQPPAFESSADRGPVIELDDVRKIYRTGSLEVAALRGVSTAIDEGEYVAIMGPSGSGKSTLMHILGCLDVPTSGRYRLAGEDVGVMSEEELAEVRNRRIGFVFQQFNLLPSLSAWRNVELPLCYAGGPRSERKERALAALDRVGLADRVDHRPGELSGGQQQRVAVARALVTDPAMILADEPTGNLDSSSTEDVLGLLAELHESGRTIVLITHEADVAAAAGRILRIRDGQILADSRQADSAGSGTRDDPTRSPYARELST